MQIFIPKFFQYFALISLKTSLCLNPEETLIIAVRPVYSI